MVQAYTEWYYEQPNAIDELGLLEYTRGKGFATAGYSPISAIKAQLAAENGGKKLTKVERTDYVKVVGIDLKNVIIPNPKHYEEVDAKAPTTPYRGSKAPVVLGVVVEQNGKYVLVDGYHRTKWINSQDKKKRRGTYIVLTTAQSERDKNKTNYSWRTGYSSIKPAYVQTPLPEADVNYI